MTEKGGTIYAIIQSGGKQYRVAEGDRIRVERLPQSPGSTVELEPLLLGGDKVLVGQPTVPEAKIIASVTGEGKGKKVIVFKYKPKVRYRRKNGHRQLFTELTIEKIQWPEIDSLEIGKIDLDFEKGLNLTEEDMELGEEGH